ncbi:MAG: radical SAM protein [Oligoflexia bacterium]|nr:radical SAM protein [Oligoflexia bacterium]
MSKNNHPGDNLSRRSIILNVSPSCFVACVGCYNNFADSWRDKSTVKVEEILSFVQNAKHRGHTKITLGGGDPLSRPDIIELLGGIRNLGLKVHLDTVGTAFLADANTIFHGKGVVRQVDPASLSGLVDLIGIPLDGANQETASLFRRGRPDLFAEQVRIIRLLTSAGHQVCVNTVVSQYNVDRLVPLFECISALPIKEWQLFQFMPIGPLGTRNQEKLWISEPEFQAAVQEIQLLNQERGSQILVKPKSINDRAGRYLIVDDSGMAWSPTGLDNNVVRFGSIREHRGLDVLDLVEYLDRAATQIDCNRTLRLDAGRRNAPLRDQRPGPTP